MNSGNCLQYSFFENLPRRFELISFMDNDFELPGGPINSIGILFKIQTKLVNRFYLNALL
jgi:hypothetical protein